VNVGRSEKKIVFICRILFPIIGCALSIKNSFLAMRFSRKWVGGKLSFLILLHLYLTSPQKNIWWSHRFRPSMSLWVRRQQFQFAHRSFCVLYAVFWDDLYSIGVTQNASAYQDLATSNSNIYAEYTEISYRNGW